MRLRAYLLLMAAAILVPVIGFYASALNMLENSGRDAAFRQLHEKANSISLIVERELASSEAALRVLATSINLKNGDFAAFHEQAKSANRGLNAWTVLLDENGQQLVNTVVPYGTTLSPPVARERMQEILAAGGPTVSDVIFGAVSGKLVTTLNLPVQLENGKRYVVSTGFSTAHFNQLILSSEVSNEWLVAIIDSQGRFIARNVNTEKTIGKLARPELVAAIQADSKGMIRHRTLEGSEVYDTFKRVSNTKWSVAIAAPVSAIDAAAVKAANFAGAGMLGGVLMAAFVAYAFGGRIVRSIKHAAEAALELGQGRDPDFAHSNIKEVRDLYNALSSASKQLSQAQKSRSQAEARALEAGGLLELAVNAAELGTFYCPVPLDIIYMDANCLRHFFLNDEASIDFGIFYGLLHPDDRERTRLAVESAVYNHEIYDVEYRAQAPDGRTRWIRAKGRAYYNEDGQPNRFDGITIDISRNKEVEERLQRVSRQKDDFLAMLAHELRNPLAPISAAASLLSLPGADQARIESTSKIIARQVDHMAALLDDLLDVARVTRGMIKLKKSSVDIKGVVSAAAEQVHPLIREKNHHLAVGLSSEPAYVFGDEKRLIQIIVNLLTNAAKYTPEGGAIRLTLETNAENVFIRVQDSGNGIAPDLIGRVFELFVQGERTLDREQGGLGLGLALVKSLTELHSGEVQVTSDGLGKGSLFTIRLPRHQAAVQGTLSGSAQLIAGRPAKHLKIMVVDDNADAGQMLAMNLEAAGHEVLLETDPHNALKVSSQVLPDVFILDIGMPGMNGNELARKLRMQPQTRDAHLVAVTGYGQESDKVLSTAAGFEHHLLKPVDMHKLLTLLQELVERQA